MPCGNYKFLVIVGERPDCRLDYFPPGSEQPAKSAIVGGKKSFVTATRSAPNDKGHVSGQEAGTSPFVSTHGNMLYEQYGSLCTVRHWKLRSFGTWNCPWNAGIHTSWIWSVKHVAGTTLSPYNSTLLAKTGKSHDENFRCNINLPHVS